MIFHCFDRSFILSTGKHDKYTTRLGIVKPLIGGVEAISYPESSGFLVSGATPGRLWGHQILLPQDFCGKTMETVTEQPIKKIEFFRCPQSLPGVAPLTKKPEDFGYEIGWRWYVIKRLQTLEFFLKFIWRQLSVKIRCYHGNDILKCNFAVPRYLFYFKVMIVYLLFLMSF